MPEISRLTLFGKLGGFAYRSIESATVYCKLRGNPYVELQHWLFQILQSPDSDLHRILQHAQIDAGTLAADLTASLDRLPRGASSITDLSTQLEHAVERGWVYGSLMFGADRVRTGHLLVGMLKTPSLRNALIAMSRQFERVPLDALTTRFAEQTAGSPEAAESPTPATAAPGEASDAIAPAAMGRQEAIKRFAVDLTARARSGGLDPVTGRDDEIRQMVDILMRRRQNNPILTGEAGVGKTAVVEGLALRIAAGDVPPALQQASLVSLDVGLLQAGASMKGEFESRLRQFIDEVQASPTPILVFIDEVHTLVGAGGAAGTGDAANLLKPALARGTLRTIGATTWSEYKKYIEKDPALTRRFQVVQVPEPDEARAVAMLRGAAAVLERHHGVALLDEAIRAAVKLSHRYIPARQLPDKAVSLLDTACARVAVSQHVAPAPLDDARKAIAALDVQAEILARERAMGEDTAERDAALAQAQGEARGRLEALEARHEKERVCVERIFALRRQLRELDAAAATAPEAVAASDAGGSPADPEAPSRARASDTPSVERDAVLADLHAEQAALHALQGDAPLILPTVDETVVAAVVQDWTGIPVGRMVNDEIAAVLRLADTLGERVIGQGHALSMIAARIQTSRAGLDNPSKPVGVFLLCGTSGVGKTETALALAESLYGGEQNLITINMSEYQEAHTVSSLKGAPPGYVGYGEGGVLTEAVRRRPYSVVLLDEVEKAHPDVHELFFQVFDKGWMEDGEGRRIDFRNTVILLTSNVGSDLIMHLCRDAARRPAPEAIAQALRDPLLQVFPAALLGRLVAIPYYPLDDTMLQAIVRLQLGRIGARVRAHHGVPFEYDDAVVGTIVGRCTEVDSGGRVIDAILTNTVLPRISVEYLRRLSAGERIGRVALTVADGDFAYGFD